MRPEGDNTGSGIKNQLGRPTNLGEYAILVREAAQNSWDARINDSSASFRIDLRTLGDAASEWTKYLGATGLPNEQARILNNLNPTTALLVISDRGTSGLGGPLRSDRTNITGESADFVQFMRNVGEPRDSELGGGTYGYGKGIFYRVSEASAILVSSRHSGDPRTRQRLMGAALSETFDSEDGRRFTGRHWWGEINDDIPDPVLNEEAAEIAEALGLPKFVGDETGTDIAIVAPELGLEDEEETLESLAERIRGHIYWHLWPKFRTPQRPRGIEFLVTVNGRHLDFPSVETVPVIKNLAKSLDNIAKREGTSYTLKKYLPHELGEMSVDYVVSGLQQPRGADISSIMKFAPINPPYRHVARMRQAELVVDYFPVTAMPTTEVGYVGTFRASAFADDSFAKAEPATHDNWATAGLTRNDLGIVRGSKGFIENEANALVAARSGARSRLVQGLGRISSELGSYLAPVLEAKDGDEQSVKQKGNNASRKRRSIVDLGQTPISLEDGKPVIRHSVGIREKAYDGARLKSSAFVVLANGKREKPENAPVGASNPSFRGWFDSETGELLGEDETLLLKGIAPGVVVAKYEPAFEAAVKTVVEILDV